jgi:hypothetical protein
MKSIINKFNDFKINEETLRDSRVSFIEDRVTKRRRLQLENKLNELKQLSNKSFDNLSSEKLNRFFENNFAKLSKAIDEINEILKEN